MAGEGEKLRSADEAALVQLAQDGSRAAFAEIYRRYHDQVLRLARSRLADPPAAEEVAQDTFLKAYLALGGLDPKRPLWPWLATVAGRLVIDVHRQRRRVLPVAIADARLDQATPDLTLETVLAAERLKDLADALLELPERHRRLLLSYVIDEMTPAELAQKENVSEVSIASVIYRARAALRRHLRRVATVLVGLGWLRERAKAAVQRSLRSPSLVLAECAEATLCWSAALAISVLVVGVPAGLAPSPAATQASDTQQLRPRMEDRVLVATVPAPVGVREPKAPPRAPASVSVATRSGPVRDKAVTPSSGQLRIDVVGPDGQTLAYYEASYDCADTGADVVPDAGPIRSTC